MKRTRHRASIERVLARKRHERGEWGGRVFRSIDAPRLPLLYRRDGKPYTGTNEEQTHAWAEDLKSQRHVALTRFEGGGKLSTVWLGTDMGFGWMVGDSNRPLIFETMLFRADDPEDQWQERYTTEEEALAGHQEKLAELLARGFVEAKQ